MRSRLAIVLSLVLLLGCFVSVGAPSASATITLAQQPGEDAETQGGETGDEDGAGQSDPDAETGADDSQQEDAVVEEGPPWTYQMAWITIALLLLLGISLVLLYYRLVAQRRKGEV